jgi:hypothetical protein
MLFGGELLAESLELWGLLSFLYLLYFHLLAMD